MGGDEIDAAIRRALDAGVVVVAAAGNNGVPVCEQPAASAGLLCVGAVDRNKQRSFFSSFGSGLGVVAPGGDGLGEDILSTVPPSTYEELAGTSQAAPHVAGVAALLAGARRPRQGRDPADPRHGDRHRPGRRRRAVRPRARERPRRGGGARRRRVRRAAAARRAAARRASSRSPAPRSASERGAASGCACARRAAGRVRIRVRARGRAIGRRSRALRAGKARTDRRASSAAAVPPRWRPCGRGRLVRLPRRVRASASSLRVRAAVADQHMDHRPPRRARARRRRNARRGVDARPAERRRVRLRARLPRVRALRRLERRLDRRRHARRRAPARGGRPRRARVGRDGAVVDAAQGLLRPRRRTAAADAPRAAGAGGRRPRGPRDARRRAARGAAAPRRTLGRLGHTWTRWARSSTAACGSPPSTAAAAGA